MTKSSLSSFMVYWAPNHGAYLTCFVRNRIFRHVWCWGKYVELALRCWYSFHVCPNLGDSVTKHNKWRKIATKLSNSCNSLAQTSLLAPSVPAESWMQVDAEHLGSCRDTDSCHHISYFSPSYFIFLLFRFSPSKYISWPSVPLKTDKAKWPIPDCLQITSTLQSL